MHHCRSLVTMYRNWVISRQAQGIVVQASKGEGGKALSNDSMPDRQNTDHEATATLNEHTQQPGAPAGPQQPVGLSLRHNFLWTLLGNLVFGACQWGILIALAKLGSPELVGRFALALAITAPVIMLLSLQLKIVQATDAKITYRFADYLALRLIASGLAMAVICALAIAMCNGFDAVLTVIAIGAAKTFESISDIYYGLLQLHERMDRMAISSLLKGPLALIAITAGVYLTGGVLWGSIAMAATVALVLTAYDIPSAKRMMRVVRHLYESADQSKQSPMHPIWDRKALISLTRLSLPLGFTMMLISLNANIPRYFIVHSSGERQLGIFAAMSYLLVAGAVGIGALAESASPKLAKHYAAGDAKSFCALLAEMVGIGAMAGAVTVGVVVWAGRPLLACLYGPEYAHYPAAFAWIAVATAIAFIQWFLGTGMTAARCFRVQVVLLGSNTIITLVACLVLIPRYGLLGGALALVVANAALALGTLAVVLAAIGRIRHDPTHNNQSA